MEKIDAVISQLDRVKNGVGYYLIDLHQQQIEQIELKDKAIDEEIILDKLQRSVELLETDVNTILIENGVKIFIRRIGEAQFFVFVTRPDVVVGIILRIIERI
ncbi:MAG: hypothetical protein GXO13_05270 [Epsilonproteobacteria bacterium]|jgi:hypothetical protein|nr:hypothetical protein [Campylobacterota bacterium]